MKPAMIVESSPGIGCMKRWARREVSVRRGSITSSLMPLSISAFTFFKVLWASRMENDTSGLAPMTTITSAPWADDHVVGGDLNEAVGRLKRESTDGVLFHGGASTGRELARLGLIDRWILVHHPVALGEGLPIFAAEQAVRLEAAHVFEASGAVALTYRPA